MKQQESISTHRETVRGVIVPREWDKRFQVTGILIACKGEREIRVENLKKFPALLSLAQQETLVTGTVRKHGDVESIIVERVDVIKKTDSV